MRPIHTRINPNIRAITHQHPRPHHQLRGQQRRRWSSSWQSTDANYRMPKHHLAVTIVRSATTQAEPNLNHIGLSGAESKEYSGGTRTQAARFVHLARDFGSHCCSVGPWILKTLHDLGDDWSKASTSNDATQKVLTSGKLFQTHSGRAKHQCKPVSRLTRIVYRLTTVCVARGQTIL